MSCNLQAKLKQTKPQIKTKNLVKKQKESDLSREKKATLNLKTRRFDNINSVVIISSVNKVVQN